MTFKNIQRRKLLYLRINLERTNLTFEYKSK